MKVKPNLTVIEGVVRAIRPDAGGYGSNVEIEVSRNVSPDDGDDFLKPKPGELLALFTPETPAAKTGQRVRVRARLLAGPSGERSILEDIAVIAGGGAGH
jgi:hypothetical protein